MDFGEAVAFLLEVLGLLGNGVFLLEEDLGLEGVDLF